MHTAKEIVTLKLMLYIKMIEIKRVLFNRAPPSTSSRRLGG